MSIKTAKACKTCTTVILGKGEPCPICKSTDTLSPNWGGLIIVLNPERSQIAKHVNLRRHGLYAIRVRQ
ncbi:MAG: transcription elongation factor subunit Spt4 [Candidatus Hodarchaeales archaeon]